jgi:acyl-CoA hydrolase
LAQIQQLSNLNFSQLIHEGDLVCYGQGPAEPLPLTKRLMAQRSEIGPFSCFIGIGWSDTADPKFTDTVSFTSYCGTGTNRKLIMAGQLSILPVHYSAMTQFLAQRVDVLLIQLAPTADKNAYSFSLACEYLFPLMKTARLVIAEVNDQAPPSVGERTVSADEIDIIVLTSRELAEPNPVKLGDVESRIATHIASLVEDGATLQIGLGAIPEAVLSALSAHRDLGVHSGLVGDSIVDLVESGVITNARKPIGGQYIVSGLLAGGLRLNTFVRDNQDLFRLRTTAYTHEARILANMNRFTAINSAIEVDLCGQVNSEVAGGLYVGAVGGLMDFIRGAHASPRGQPIIALPSTAKGNMGPVSRIVPRLSGPATLPHADAPIVVTEFGVADLRGLDFSQRRKRLIDIAHPDFRDGLDASGSLMRLPSYRTGT